jgi:hypothetical protein
MRGNDESVDVVVRSGGSVLCASSIVLQSDFLTLVGTLLDPEIRAATGAPSPISAVIEMSLDSELAGGTHIERETTWTLETDEISQAVRWAVASRELSEGFALQDAKAQIGDLEFRAFAIEDLAATVGVCLAGGIGALAVWLQHKRGERAGADALRAAEQQFRECLESGGSPKVKFGVTGDAGVGLTPDAQLRIRQGASYEVDCQAPR